MNSRRTVFGLIASWFLGMRGQAQVAKRSPGKELARHALTGPQAGMEVILVEVTASAGAASKAHRHPGFVLGYVLEGEMAFAINGEGQQVLKTGETFFEPSGALHTIGGSAKPDSSVRFLAFIVAPKGSPVTLPA